MALAAAWVNAQSNWGNFAVISDTLGNYPNRICVGEGLRVSDIGCPSYAPFIRPNDGYVGIGTTNPNAALDVHGTVSATNLRLSGNLYVSGSQTIDGVVFANGGVSATGVVTATAFYGDGSGLTGLAAGDRIVSGSSNVTVAQNGSVTISTNGNQRILVGANGSMGIGTSTPGARFEVRRDSYSGPMAILGRGQDANYILAVSQSQVANTAGTRIGQFGLAYGMTDNASVRFHRGSTSANGFLSFATAGENERMRIDGAGNVGIGTSIPSTTLHVSGSVLVAGNDNKPCEPGMQGLIRRNATNGRMEVCE